MVVIGRLRTRATTVGAGTTITLMLAAVIGPAVFLQVSRWVDPVTGEVVHRTGAFSIGHGKRTGQRDDLVECEYDAEFHDPESSTVTVEATVTSFLAPCRRGGL